VAKFFPVNRYRQKIILKGEYPRLSVLILLSVILLFLPVSKTIAQDNTLFLMPDIPQANQLNPAYFKLCRIYVELPVISSVKLNIRNTGFGFHDVISRGTGDQANVFLVDLSKLDQKLKRINYSQIETDIDLLGFGFGYKEWYFTFGISNHSDMLLYYPHDVMSLRDNNLQSAITNGTPINITNAGTEITLWNSIGVSAAKEISDGLKIGFRLKYLQGMANAVSRRSDLYIISSSNPESLAAGMNYQINASFPVNVKFTPNGLVNSINVDNANSNVISNYIFNGNRGASFDAGVVYEFDEKTEVSASVTDLGFIHWKKNANNYSATGNYFLNATNIAQLVANPGQVNVAGAVRDSISGAFRVSSKSYFTLTPVKIFGGVTRLLMPGLRAGAMTRIEIYNMHVLPSLSLSMNYTPKPWFAGSVSYTIMNNKLNQVGAGIALGNRIVQFYAITDNIVTRFTKDISSPLFWPYNARMVSLRFGLNLLFGCKKKDNKYHSTSKDGLCPAYK
jgi:hypothetical protein